MRNSIEISKDLDAKLAIEPSDAEARENLASEIRDLSAELSLAKAEENAKRAQATRTLSAPEAKELKRFSISKFIRETAKDNLSGFEAEMAQEGAREMDKCGVTRGGQALPSFLLRDYYYENATDTGYGPEFNHVTRMDYVEALKNNLVCRAAGVQYLDGLQGQVKLVRGGGATANWVAEEAAASVNRQSYTAVTMTPKRLQILAGYTYDLLKQSSIAVDDMIMMELVNEHAAALDAAILNGSGSSGQPTGILNTSGINSVVMGPNGGNLTYAKVIDLEKEVAIDNGLRGRLAYMTNPKVFANMKTIAKVAGYPSYIFEDGKVNGYPIYVTNAIPSTLTKGTSSGNCSALLFGNFQEAIVGQWGGLEFIVDVYSKKANGVVEVSAFAYHDVAVRHAVSFGSIADITIA